MEWQAAILALQIMVVAVIWILFQKARADLSAQAASTPILAEVKALQRNVRQLLTEIDQTSEEASTRLEQQIREARRALTLLEEEMAQARNLSLSVASAPPVAVSTMPVVVNTTPILPVPASPVVPDTLPVENPRTRKSQRKSSPTADSASRTEIKQGITAIVNNREDSDELTAQKLTRENRRDTVYRMADSGSTSAAIACATRLTEGEVETVLGLRRLS